MRQEDFDDNYGAWNLGISGDDATTGLWDVVIPVGSFYGTTAVQTDEQHTPGGQYCALTGNAPSTTSGLGVNDVDAGETTLESPTYDLSGYANPIFSFYRWYVNNPPTGANPANDTWEVNISNDGGATWSNIERTNVSDKSWRKYAFRVKDYVTLTSNVKIRFVAEDSLIPGAYLDGGSLVEAALDDIYLYEEGTTGLEDNSSVSYMNVYPNPAVNALNIAYSLSREEEVSIEIRNALGQLVYSIGKTTEAAGGHMARVETTALAAGLYSVNIQAGKTSNFVKFSVMK
jgi:hypothetical protein